MHDLRTFLEANESSVRRISEPLSVKFEITALQYLLWERNEFPVILAENPRLENGGISGFQAVTNLTASRELTAKILGISDHRNAAREIAAKLASCIEPVTVDPRNAPCKEVKLTGEDANLDQFPIFTQHTADAGAYLTAAHATTYDPETGIDNTAIQRVWVRSKNRFGYFPYPTSHNRKNIMKFWKRGESAPIAFWIGHHPAVSIGAQAKLDYPESHWSTAGGLIGAPVRLVPTELFGDELKVPADAEIVLEGFVPPNVFEPEGGFGEYTGFSSGPTLSPIFELKLITHRRGAVYHDYGSGLPDSLVPDNMMIEARLFSIAEKLSDQVRGVHVPVSGRRFHAYVAVGEITENTAQAMLTALLRFRRVKHVVLVNDDIDIFDEQKVLWAIATRAQMDRDAFIFQDLEGSSLDPSLTGGVSQTSKIGVNATWKSNPPTPNMVPAEVLEKVRKLIFGD
ncbi:MAG: UbiD family decarboxylase [Acidobacteria bacterium]|nr:UbiD family decarboxylase [Acidobacteriota bacterium]